MDTLKHAPYQRIALENSLLGRLPPELILEIADSLPPENAILFSLCCRYLYNTISATCIATLKKPLDLSAFLELLAKDFAHYIACKYCKKLHATSAAAQHIPSNRTVNIPRKMFCWDSPIDELCATYIHHDFSFTVFQMTMKADRHGLQYSHLLDLLSAKAQTWSFQREGKGCVFQQSSLAKIVEGSLIIRQMTILFIPSKNGHPQPWKLHHPTSCSHMKLVIRWAERKGGPYDSIFDEDWEEFNRCWNCVTEYRLDCKESEKHGQAIFFTKWTDLGRGVGEGEREFRKHLDGRRGWEEEFPYVEPGSVCKAFEGQDEKRFRPYSFWGTGDRRVVLAKGKQLASGDMMNERVTGKMAPIRRARREDGL
ncbi:hypothetical protein NA56DRAFT_705574 [Hyaloscypha hepaticicola]|uniref:F-box domain-containing protein n=1 Tax=Hyaloscypha hepaticicola TaxID=2082293 RepID=A0A2J6PZF1_9HELO|nr:hypothetical protein NA56DRAFT_705574 [Hyaloscypha hepaticicola]